VKNLILWHAYKTCAPSMLNLHRILKEGRVYNNHKDTEKEDAKDFFSHNEPSLFINSIG
jgi:hypothetical protein